MTEHKSEQMKQTALANGWKSEVIPNLDEFNRTGNPDDIVWNVYALRGLEAMHVVFTGDRQTKATYTYGENYKLTPARRAPVIALLTGTPDPKKLKGKQSGEELIQNHRSVPWEDDAPALDILMFCLGKDISWIRRIDSEVMTGFIPEESNKKSRNYRVYENKNGDRFLEWTNAEGFHTVRIDSIISVG
ncbi:hypothetical protein SEA_BECKERTON_59 [Mycobacterium phage Beckerton]|nr:hypothetical protein SEA_BECKERTON_59 [Mycobacterium phage Beckerton]